MSIVEQAEQSIDRIREKTDTAILFCSFGKDSLVMLDLVAPKFNKVICVFMYFVKGLEHIEKYIRWATSKYDNIVIEQYPHWNLTYLMRSGLFCTRNPNVKLLKLSDVNTAVCKKHNVKYSFFGMKKADGMNRRLMLNTYENNENNGMVYPLADWKKKDVMAYIKLHKIPEPVMYSKKASGGCGFNIECFLYLRENYPQDLMKILQAFPMSEKLLYDYDNKQKQA